jgi:hypothetical protein
VAGCTIRAEIQEGNIASRRAAEKAGYVLVNASKGLVEYIAPIPGGES